MFKDFSTEQIFMLGFICSMIFSLITSLFNYIFEKALLIRDERYDKKILKSLNDTFDVSNL